MCEGDDCKDDAHWGPEEGMPTFCEEHKRPESINHAEIKCPKCHEIDFIRATQPYCDGCTELKNFKKIQHTKELRIKRILEENNIVYDSHDKTIDVACDLKRPDFVIYCAGETNDEEKEDPEQWAIIIEVDENQHRGHGYNCTCEQARMLNLYSTIGLPTLIIIRYNPDTFKDSDGKKWTSRNRNLRERRLLKTIQSHQAGNNTKKMINLDYMFYDGCDLNSNDKFLVDPMTFEETQL